MGWSVAEGERIYGIVLRLLASPESNFDIQQVIDRFYASPYFKGYGLKPIRKIGFDK